ncbi:MAG: hypothetical protein ACXVH6_02515 [Halobacteriota archaeon]
MYGLKLTVLQINVVLIFLGLPSMFVICYLIQALQDEAVTNIISRIRSRNAGDTADHAVP